ncbi:MAG: SHOCT domain-containing protein [Acidimicrobiales bacterium]
MMMSTGWGFFPWPVLVVIPAMGAMVVFMVLRSGFGRGAMGPGCGPGPRPAGLVQPVEGEAVDPIDTLKERFVRGEIDLAEFEHRLEGLLRSDPTETTPWWNK